MDSVACIDISNLAERKHEVVRQLMDAAESIGFFQVVGMSGHKLALLT